MCKNSDSYVGNRIPDALVGGWFFDKLISWSPHELIFTVAKSSAEEPLFTLPSATRKAV